MVTVKLSGSTRMSGIASLCGRSALPTPRQSRTPTRGRSRPSRSASPSSIAAGATHATLVWAAVRGAAPNIGRGSTGCGVGMEALASPICAHAIMPPLTTTSGFTPKNLGSHRTRSASFPTSTDPTSASRPWAMAAAIVYLAT